MPRSSAASSGGLVLFQDDRDLDKRFPAGRPLRQQQRLLIAQALVTRPRILALDEPLDSLDLRNQQGVAGVIRQISREMGAAVLLVAHDINPILSAVDRVVYMAHGQVAVGTPEEVITTETLSLLYMTPIEVLRASDGQIVVVGQPEEEVCYHAGLHR